jgi:hypothetical protein
LGNLSAAQIQFDRGLELMRKAKGEDDAETIDMTSDVAMMLRLRGKYAESESMCREIVNKSSRILGKNHPITLRAIGLGKCTRFGWRALRQAILVQAFDLKKPLGDDDSQTLVSMNTLANIYKDECKYDQASNCIERCGSYAQPGWHPDMIFVENNLAIVFKLQDFDKAREMYNRVLKFADVFGDDHPNTHRYQQLCLILLDEPLRGGREMLVSCCASDDWARTT